MSEVVGSKRPNSKKARNFRRLLMERKEAKKMPESKTS
jgi:hypothetical protein